MAKAGLSTISRQGYPARKRLLPSLKFHSAFFPELLMKQWVGLRRNRVTSLIVADVIEPRRTAQRVPNLLRIEPIFAKILPDIPAQVIQPICVCRKTSHGTRPPITVVVPFDHRPMGVFVPWLLLSGIIPRALRRPPFLAPCIELDLASCTSLIREPNSFRKACRGFKLETPLDLRQVKAGLPT
jgi:hypothetical protein